MNIENAAKILQSGGVVAIPTETVYGLAALLTCERAIQKIFHLKNRPQNNPIIVHVADRLQVKSLISHFPPNAEALMEKFWPGPLTLIFEADTGVVPFTVRGGLQTVGIRMPQHEETLKLIKKTGPIVAPSANVSGRPSPTSALHVEEDFGNQVPILDGGPCSHGLESTILFNASDQWEIVRQGALSPEDFTSTLGYTPKISHRAVAPGSLYRHYSPKAKLDIGTEPEHGRNVLGFSDRSYSGKRLLSLGKLSDPHSLAFNLYDRLREVDRAGIDQIWVDMDFPNHGLYQTLRERLTRAAAKEHL